tara:strand:+ start:2058 stop:2687 length:630 start_codon:yes stop_codon:yes gene_type:complete
MTTDNNKLTPTQARAARRERKQNKSKITRWLIGIAIVGVASLLIISLILPMIGGIGGGGAETPDGPGTKVESQGREHIQEGAEHPPYNSVPATSGWHYPQPLAPVSWGVHSTFIPEEKRIHNLEHGGISITYNCPEGCEDIISELNGIVERARDENMKILLSPYPGTERKITLTSWTFIQSFDNYDKGKIIDFIDSHHNSPNSPEPYAN